MRPASRTRPVVSAAVFALLVCGLLAEPAQGAGTTASPGVVLPAGTATVAVASTSKAKKSKKARKKAKKRARRAAAAAAAAALAAPARVSVPLPGPPCAASCTLADDFDGAALNSSLWRVLTTQATGHGRANADCWTGDPANVSVAGGVLRLTTRREARVCRSQNGSTFRATHTSGSVATLSTFNQTYGRWLIRARFPQTTTAGAHGALWLWPTSRTTGWPASGEIDVAEFYSRFPDRVIPYLHYVPWANDPTVTNNYCMVNQPWEFHTYELQWRYGRLTISYDGVPCIDHFVNPLANLFGQIPFNQPYFLLLTQMLGDGINAPLAATPSAMTTEVDWVRVWR